MRDNSHPFLSQKLSWNKSINQDNLQVDAVCKFSLATLLFSQVNLLGSYSHKNYIFWAGSKWSAADSNKAIFAALYKAKKFDSVIKVSLGKTPKKNLNAKFTVGTVFQLDEKTTLRARVSKRLNISMLKWTSKTAKEISESASPMLLTATLKCLLDPRWTCGK